MPIQGARYRVVRTSKGLVRLAFRGSKVVEAKNLKTGAMHTQKEFVSHRKSGGKRGK